MSIILFIIISFAVFFFTKSSTFFNNSEKIIKIEKTAFLTFWIIILVYSIFLITPFGRSSCGILIYKEARQSCYKMKVLDKPLSKVDKSDLKYCEKSEEPDVCYEDIAKKLNDPSACSNIKFSGDKECCFLLEKTVMAANQKNDNICNELKSIYEKDENDIWSRCYKMQDYVNLCYQKVALATNDESYCEKINTEYVGTHYEILLECYRIIAKNKNDTSVCDGIKKKEHGYAWVKECVKYVNNN
jgi:hypothetical protein